MKFASLIVILNSYKKERKIKEHAFHPETLFSSHLERKPIQLSNIKTEYKILFRIPVKR